jgi:hypothetical protein
MNFDS